MRATRRRSASVSLWLVLICLVAVQTFLVLIFRQPVSLSHDLALSGSDVSCESEAKHQQHQARDSRYQLDRNGSEFMTAASHSMINSIRDFEEAFRSKGAATSRCSTFGGLKYMNQLLASQQLHLQSHNNTLHSSKLWTFHNVNMNVYVAENVSLIVYTTTNQSNRDIVQKVEMKFLGGDLELSSNDDNSTRSELRPESGAVLKNMTWNLQADGKQQKPIVCQEFIDHPVLLVDGGEEVDHNNWWFFLQELMKHYMVHALVQPLVQSEYRHSNDLEVLHTMSNDKYQRSFTDGYDYLLGRSRRLQDLLVDKVSNVATADDGSLLKRHAPLCFRKVAWSPGVHAGSEQLLRNHRHRHMDCVSSIQCSFAAQLKSSLRIPTTPSPPKPRVVWVARDMSAARQQATFEDYWQQHRIIKNQDEVIQHLKEQCLQQFGAELVVADFYGPNKLHTPYAEQAHFIARTHVMIGIHGAGLNMAWFMPPNSVVVEIHSPYSEGHFNSRNTLAHLGGDYKKQYIPVYGLNWHKKGNNDMLPLDHVWNYLKKGIEAWYELNHPKTQ